MSNKFTVAPNPCATCPYRKDTPSGIWAQEEYDKLPEWDEPMALRGVFLCHNGCKDTKDKMLCRGWFEVHRDNISVKLAEFKTELTKANRKPTKVPLYASGAEARAAGMAEIELPSDEAFEAMGKITEKRERLKRKATNGRADSKRPK